MTQLAALTKSLWRRWMLWIPIRILSAKHRPKIAAHLKSLGTQDRYLRFGYPATDEQIDGYVAKLDFVRDDIYGVFNRRLQIVSMAHLAFSVDPQWATCAEFGVSVDLKMRGRGLGARMFDRAMTHARNEGVSLMFIHALSENTPMLKIARKAGARVERDGSESDAYLSLQPANLDSQMHEFLEEGMADLDFQIKTRARQFLQLLRTMQEVRRGVRDARHQSGV
ncbi:GNAT family N-acetyltransferase [Limnohabitans sp. 103DPR2]|uniref:GNAT family N-acetyltransferase n=1 Tax=Limnohabitans sp. 103DPR2 TaxID=1678129 RepID=UPI0007067CE1|nr:GNAT family N-acetyltransferase [Limnohabitans sp. 103DPR2]ALK90468.1 Acetyltransferase (GNAT) family protein [Limnohabitans sp. 103DPR2]